MVAGRRLTASGLVAVALATSTVMAQAIPSFSGADGAGAIATGGRGGDVYRVTVVDQNASDNRPGTLYSALQNIPSGGRTVVFDVSGTFRLDRKPTAGYEFDGNGWDTASRLNLGSNVTIAGQTAPGPVVIMGGLIKAGGNNTILRNVTIAPGYGRRNFANPGVTPVPGTYPDQSVYDAIDITGTRQMIDHVTTVYATDETISANELANHVTIQYSNISQGQNYPQNDAEANARRYTGHGLGSLLQGGTDAKFSIHHNLYAHQKGRLPRVGTEKGKLTGDQTVGAYNDFRNNVFYNWFDTAGGGANNQPSQNNFVGNFYRVGPGGDDVQQHAGPDGRMQTGDDTASIIFKAGGTGIFNGANSSVTKLHQSGNVRATGSGTNPTVTALGASAFTNVSAQASAYDVGYTGITDSAADAYARVLNYAGARWWDRSEIDQRIFSETATGTGKIMAWADDPFNNDPNEGVEWRNLVNTPTIARAANFDTDGDGMPDVWEIKHGLNPAVADHNGDFDADGYTNIEEYINELAEWPASRPLVFTGATNNRYAQITNWDIAWQPSKFDVARIVSGIATVDSVGQHARVITVGDTSGQTGTLNVTAGWIDVVETIEIGRVAAALAGTGSVTQSGGTVLVGEGVFIGSNGSYALSGGSLVTPLLAKVGVAGAPEGTFTFTGGTLNVGRVTFDLVVNGGTLAPGLGVGETIVDGDLILQAGSLVIELASPTAFDSLLVGESATLGGALTILTGFEPIAGQSWTILTAVGGVTGAFASITPGFAASIVGNSVVLSVVPEPTAAFATLSCLALIARRRKGNHA